MNVSIPNRYADVIRTRYRKQHSSTIEGMRGVLERAIGRHVSWATSYEILAGSGKYRDLDDLVQRRVDLAKDDEFMATDGAKQGVAPEEKAADHYYNERRADREALYGEPAPPIIRKKKRRKRRTKRQLEIGAIRSAAAKESWRKRKQTPIGMEREMRGDSRLREPHEKVYGAIVSIRREKRVNGFVPHGEYAWATSREVATRTGLPIYKVTRSIRLLEERGEVVCLAGCKPTMTRDLLPGSGDPDPTHAMFV